MPKGFSYTEKIKRNKIFALIIFIFIVLIILYQLISSFIFKTYRLQTNMMYPTFEKGEILGATPIFHAENLQRGDIVFRKALYKSDLNIFEKTVDAVCALFTAKLFQPFSRDRTALTSGTVLRVIGLPGDTIYLDNFVAYIKNTQNENFLTEFELSDIDYNISTTQVPNNWERSLPFSAATKTFVLGKNEFFLLSDNRIASFDSRLSGTCSAANISEKIICVTWPFKAWKKF